MKQIIAIAACLLASLAGASASAQDHVVKATVPFGFYVGNNWTPAGTYILSSDVMQPDLISIRNADTNKVVMSLALPADRQPGSDKLVISKHGDQYFLHEIHCSSRDMNVEFPHSKKERLAESQQASAASESTIYLALR